MIWVISFVLLGLLLWVAFRPVTMGELASHPDPVVSYEEAVARIKAMQEQDDRDLTLDVCITKLYAHGRQTDHVIVLIHGFTNCPEQFSEIGKQHFEAGHNVFIPRTPYHGLSDRLTDALINLKADDIAAFGDQVIDIAHGLGRKVTVMGVSGSGTLVAWLAQNRADIDYAFALAPLLGLAFVPSSLTRLFEQIALRLPNFFLWWDPRTKAANPYSIYYAYPRYPTRALVQFLKLAMTVRAQAEKSPPKTKKITMIVNDAEPAVSNPEIARLIRLWQKYENVNLGEVHFEKDMNLPHDIITPGTPGLPTAEIQPRLIHVVRERHLKIEYPSQ